MLVLLVALAGGVVIATLAGAQRTYTAVQRLNAKILPADVMVLPNQPGFNWSQVRTLPSVKTLGTFVLPTGASPRGVGVSLDSIAGFPAGDRVQNVSVDRPAIISGHLADPGNPNEIVVTPGFVEKYGDTIAMRLPTRAQADELRSTTDPPSNLHFQGPIVHLHVVGVGVNTFDLGPGNGPALMPTFAFFRDYIRPYFPYLKNARVRLRGGPASIPAFRRQLAAATHDPNIDVVDWRDNVLPIERAAAFTSVSWLLFSLIALLASLVLVGQAFMRFCAVRSDDLRTLEALGLRRRQTLIAAGAGPGVATVVGTSLALGIAVILSTLFPSGLAGKYESSPGLDVAIAPLALGGLLIGLLGLLGAWWSARASLRSGSDSSIRRPSFAATQARQLGLGVSVVLGVCFALEPTQSRGRASVRPALLGVVAGILGIVGALTFRSGLDGTVDDATRFGQTLTMIGFISEGAPPPGSAHALRVAARDPDIAVLDDMRIDVFPVNGRPVSTFSLNPLKGQVDVVSLVGRAPAANNEISLGPLTAQALNVRSGSRVNVAGRSMTVSGITLVPVDSHNGYSDGAWLSERAFDQIQPDLAKDKFHEVRFTFRRGVDQKSALKRLPPGLGPGGIGPVSSFATIDEQVELRSVQLQPLLLGGFLVLLALGAVGHGLVTVVGQRRREVAVLRTFGLTRRQTRAAVAVQASVLATVGLVFGIPLGIIVGRSAWRLLAQATPVLYVAPVPVLAVVMLVPAAVLTTNLLAAIPARPRRPNESGRRTSLGVSSPTPWPSVAIAWLIRRFDSPVASVPYREPPAEDVLHGTWARAPGVRGCPQVGPCDLNALSNAANHCSHVRSALGRLSEQVGRTSTRRTGMPGVELPAPRPVSR